MYRNQLPDRAQEEYSGLMRNQRIVQQSNGCELANRDIEGNPETGPWGRRGSMPGVTGLQYRVVRLET